MSGDKDRILGHAADNDGIEEYDNALPDWWLGLFGFTIVWGIGYGVDYHFISQRSQAQQYEAEMAAAKERWPEATPQALAFDPATVAAGAEIYTTTCAACHGAELTGGIGPSLVDAVWIHGGEPDQIRSTITLGVADKGMPGWGAILGPDKVAKAAAFVYTRAQGGGGGGGATTQNPATAVDQSGEEIFRQNCVVCHGEQMEGKIGPSLVDAEWIHGGTLGDITQIITAGVPEKGMVSWGPILGPEKIARVAAYVHGKGTAPQ